MLKQLEFNLSFVFSSNTVFNDELNQNQECLMGDKENFSNLTSVFLHSRRMSDNHLNQVCSSAEQDVKLCSKHFWPLVANLGLDEQITIELFDCVR